MLALFAAVAVTREAEALGWIRVTNGKVVHQMDNTSSALCTRSTWIVLGNRPSTGNSVTLTNGGQQITHGWERVASVLPSRYLQPWDDSAHGERGALTFSTAVTNP